MEYIEIDKELIPYNFEITFDNETYTFEVNYNALKDFFTISLYKNDEIIVLEEKLIYGKPLFENVKYKNISIPIIIPLDLSSKNKKVTFENLNEQVFLYLRSDEI